MTPLVVSWTLIHYLLITYYLPSLILNIHIPGMSTFVVWVMLIMLEVNDPGIVLKVTPSPASIPASAAVPPNPLLPPEESPVVHSILLSG